MRDTTNALVSVRHKTIPHFKIKRKRGPRLRTLELLPVFFFFLTTFPIIPPLHFDCSIQGPTLFHPSVPIMPSAIAATPPATGQTPRLAPSTGPNVQSIHLVDEWTWSEPNAQQLVPNGQTLAQDASNPGSHCEVKLLSVPSMVALCNARKAADPPYIRLPLAPGGPSGGVPSSAGAEFGSDSGRLSTMTSLTPDNAPPPPDKELRSSHDPSYLTGIGSAFAPGMGEISVPRSFHRESA